MKNKIYLVSKILTYSFDTMSKSFKLFDDEQIAKQYFETLVNDYIIDTLDRTEYKSKKELAEEYFDIQCDEETIFVALTKDGCEEIEIELNEMEVY